jgi:hypothetical protein
MVEDGLVRKNVILLIGKTEKGRILRSRHAHVPVWSHVGVLTPQLSKLYWFSQ